VEISEEAVNPRQPVLATGADQQVLPDGGEARARQGVHGVVWRDL